MIKLMIVGRRAPGRSRKGAHGHLRDIHARMVVRAPPDAGPMPADYVQNHVVDGVYPGAGAHAIERDLVTELWFDDVGHLKASTATPYYLANLRLDEPCFVDDATVVKMTVRPTAPIGGEGGASRAFWLLSGDSERATAAFSVAPGLTRLVANAVLPPPDGGEPFVDTVLEGWFTSRDAAVAAAEMLPATLDGLDPERCLALAAEQYDTVRLRAHLEDNSR